MSRKLMLLPLLALLACCFTFSANTRNESKDQPLHDVQPHSAGKGPGPVYSSLTAHEWGTFTSIAGSDGSAVEWSPLTESTDLPGFVEHFRNAGFKRGLRGTVRMETPVLYLYDSREETVSVKVAFAKGVITEWYPHASRVEPAASIFDGTLYQPHPDGSIAWDSVTVSPSLRAEFPRENLGNHYYAARMTSSTPLRVQTPSGEQQEKFLFYRGVSTFSVPLWAKLTTSGKLLVENRGTEEIPRTILFERRGQKVGYRLGGPLQKKAVLDPPELTGRVDDLRRDLEEMLVAQGLFQDEAQAMVETWRDSWFEEGNRLLCIVPPALVNEVLPLSIIPAPAQTARVFVGRLEIVTPATERAVETALVEHDSATLKRFGRFLEPILETMIQKESKPARAQQFYQALNAYLEIAQNQRRN
jgi:hypothetical protein